MRFLKTFSKIQFQPDFDTPFSEKAVNQLIGKMNQHDSTQSPTAGSATNLLWIADFAGTVGDVYVVGTQPATNEFMLYDIRKLGASAPSGTVPTSILSSQYTLAANNNFVADQISLYGLIVPGFESFIPGDTYYAYRTYTAGTTPGMDANTVVLEPTLRKWK